MSSIPPGERKKNAATILRLLTECRDKVSDDCPEPTLKLPDSTIRDYVRNIENPVCASKKTDLEGYLQTMSALIARIEEIRDDLPTGWQDFSNWLRECTAYPKGTTPHVSTGRPPLTAIFGHSDAGANTTDKPSSFNVSVKPTEKTSTGKRTARIEVEAKRADAEIKQKQSHDEVLQRIASLEKINLSTKAIANKQKELDERAASLSKREEAVEALQAKLEADISRQAATEKAFIVKSEEVDKVFGQMQAKLDRMEKEAKARLAKTKTPIASATKQKEPVKPTIVVSPSHSNDRVVSEADKVAGPKRKSVSRIIAILNKAFPANEAVIVFDELKHKTLRVFKVGKAQRKDFEAQIDKVLALYGTPASKREQHVAMLIDLVNFEDAIGRNDDGLYSLLNATVKDAAIQYANDGLSKWLFRHYMWLDFDKVFAQHDNLQSIKTIASLGTSLFDMELALSSAEQPGEFDEEITATPSEILEEYHGIFNEYGSALRHFLSAVPESSPMYELVKAHGEREGFITYDSWYKAVHKFDVRF
ncbi:unnamed protein product [Alternaria alternata]